MEGSSAGELGTRGSPQNPCPGAGSPQDGHILCRWLVFEWRQEFLAASASSAGGHWMCFAVTALLVLGPPGPPPEGWGRSGLRYLRGQASCILGDYTCWIGDLNLPGEPWVGLKGWAESTLRTCSQLFAMHRNCWGLFSSIVLLFISLRSRGL